MPGHTTRLLLFTALLLLATGATTTGMILQGRVCGGVMLSAIVLWRSRDWLVPAIRGRLALRRPSWRLERNRLALDVPAGWLVKSRSAEQTGDRFVQKIGIAGPGASVHVCLVQPAPAARDPEVFIDTLVGGVAEELKIRETQAGTTTFAGVPGVWKRVTAGRALSAYVYTFTAVRTEELFAYATTCRIPTVPAALLERVRASVQTRDPSLDDAPDP